MRIRSIVIAFCVVSASTLGAASAATVQYTSQAAFDAASGPLTTIDFEIVPPGQKIDTPLPAGMTIGGVQFQSAGSPYIGVIDPGYNPSLYDRGTGDILYSDYSSTMVITFAQSVKTVSALIGSIFRTAPILHIGFSNGDTAFTPLVLNANWTFAGFISDSANITSLTIGNVGGDYLLLDNLRFSTTSVESNSAPTPGVVFLVGLGLIGLGISRRAGNSPARVKSR